MKNSLIICPVYNEEATLEQFFRNLRNYYFGDVLFVNDGSTDASLKSLIRIKDKHTFLINHPRRSGYGQALMTGFKFSLAGNYSQIITMDVDLQHNPEHTPFFLRSLAEYEVVLGSRYIRIDRYLDIPRQRLVINRYIAQLLREVFGVFFSDPFCGFRGYSASFLKKVRLTESSYGLALEILLEIIRTNAAFVEAPIEAIYFGTARKFLDNLDNPRRRLLYYLGIIFRKREEIRNSNIEIINTK